MAFDLFDILRNLLQTHSRELMESQMADESFDSAWNTHMVLRYLSMSGQYAIALKGQASFENLPGSVLYPVLFELCVKSGRSTSIPQQYMKSPFTR